MANEGVSRKYSSIFLVIVMIILALSMFALYKAFDLYLQGMVDEGNYFLLIGGPLVSPSRFPKYQLKSPVKTVASRIYESSNGGITSSKRTGTVRNATKRWL